MGNSLFARRGRAAAALLALALAVGAGLVAVGPAAPASAAVPGEVSCTTDGTVFNTGRDQTTGGRAPDASAEAVWEFTRGVVTPAGYDYPTGTTLAADLAASGPWRTPTVGKRPAWVDSTYPNAQWIQEPNARRADLKFEYFRLAFTLAADVDPASFRLNLNGAADDLLVNVYVNGTPAFTPSSALASFNTLVSLPALTGPWQTGANEVIVAVLDNGWDVGLLLESRVEALCAPALSIDKTAAAATVAQGDVAEYAIEVANTQAGTTATDVAVTDPGVTGQLEPLGWTCESSDAALACPAASGTGALAETVPSLPSGITLTYTVSARVLVGDRATVTNTATVSAPGARCDDPDTAGACVATASIRALTKPPVAEPDTARTHRSTPVDIDVRSNDSDPAGQPLVVVSAGSASSGTVAVVDGQVRYTPAPGFIGTATFTYEIENASGETATADVQVEVYGILSYDANGGSGDVPASLQTTAPAAPAGSADLSNAGFVFGGWNTRADGSGTLYAPGDSVDLADGDVTLYAVWSAVAVAAQDSALATTGGVVSIAAAVLGAAAVVLGIGAVLLRRRRTV